MLLPRSDSVSGTEAKSFAMGGKNFEADWAKPLPALSKSSMVYHYCPVGQQDAECALHHTLPGESRNDANKTYFGKNASNRPVVINTAEGSLVHIETAYSKVTSKNHRTYWRDNREFLAERYKNKHVYFSQLREAIRFGVGWSFKEAQNWNAAEDIANLATASQDQKKTANHVLLHNRSPEDEKFRLKVKVKYNGKVADFELDSHRHSVLHLPKGSSLEVESELQSEAFTDASSATASVTIEAEKFVAGSNLYLWSQVDRETELPEEQQFKKCACFFFWFPPLCLILLCMASKQIEERKLKNPLLRFDYLIGAPPVQATEKPSTILHCLAEGRVVACFFPWPAMLVTNPWECQNWRGTVGPCWTVCQLLGQQTRMFLPEHAFALAAGESMALDLVGEVNLSLRRSANDFDVFFLGKLQGPKVAVGFCWPCN